MKFILELILTTVIIFFVWNILKRLFFSAVFKFPKPNYSEEKRQEKSKKKLKSKITWDAETVDYEEIEEKKSK